MVIDLNGVTAACEKFEEQSGHFPSLKASQRAHFSFIDRARTWLPALVAELTQARAERDTLSALVPLYCAVDDYLHREGTNDYPADHCNPDRLAALREIFLGMSADVPSAVDEERLKEYDEWKEAHSA